ncbi:hypothetical protein SAMN02910368_01140 [Lachnospiraceae bacterium G11]|nr:hypothetical protein SAMN02910368_01140 [Lachnospiraceae bacterium G11]
MCIGSECEFKMKVKDADRILQKVFKEAGQFPNETPLNLIVTDIRCKRELPPKNKEQNSKTFNRRAYT